MSTLRLITRLWKNSEETSESPTIPELKTLYYKQSKNTVMNAVKRTLQKLPQWKVVYIDEDRGEITVEAKQGWVTHDITITICSLSVMHTAIDLLSAKRGWGGDLGQGYRNIRQFLDLINREITPVRN